MTILKRLIGRGETRSIAERRLALMNQIDQLERELEHMKMRGSSDSELRTHTVTKHDPQNAQ